MRRDRALWFVAIAATVLVAAACAGDDAAVTTSTAAAPTAPTVDSTTTTAVPSTSEPVQATTIPMPRGPVGDPETVVLEVDGIPRSYRLYVPPSLGDHPDPVPLIVDLHGFGSDPASHDRTSEMGPLADAVGFVVAQPAARGDIAAWNGQPDEPGSAADVAFIRALVADVDSRIGVDSSAVFASGFSNGGGMAHRLACDASDLFAAIGTVAGQYPLTESCEPSRPVSIISFHGTSDVVVPMTGVRRLFPDVTAWIERWGARNGCAPVPVRERRADDVLVDRWTSCDGDVEVVFYTIEEGPHAWPGSRGNVVFSATESIHASQEMWVFFRDHVRS